MIIEHEQYKCVPGSNKYYFYINSDKLEEDIKWILANKIDSIRLSQYDGYKIKSIEPILQLKHIRSLVIFLQGVDLGKLNEFNNLEELSIGESNFGIDVSDLKNLKDLYLFYHKKIKGLSSLTALKKLIIVKAEASFFSESNFSSWQNLNELASLSSKLPPKLSFIKNNRKLRQLEIHNTRTTFNVWDLSLINESLEVLKIESCKNIEGIDDVLPKLTHLRWFALTDSVTLKSTQFVDALPNLDTLVVLGSSYFENGNLNNLKNRMKHVGIDDKRHYNLKSMDFSLLGK
jgi:hypothetical protein